MNVRALEPRKLDIGYSLKTGDIVNYHTFDHVTLFFDYFFYLNDNGVSVWCTYKLILSRVSKGRHIKVRSIHPVNLD